MARKIRSEDIEPKSQGLENRKINSRKNFYYI